MKSRFHRAPLFLLCLVTVVAGCAPESPDDGESAAPPEPIGPYMMPYSFTWHKTDLADFDDAEYTFVRAYTESFLRAMDDRDSRTGFPGFKEATLFDVDAFFKSRGPAQQKDFPWHGTSDMKVISRRETPLGTEATVCWFDDRIIVEDEPGRFSHSLLIPQMLRVTYRRGRVAPPSNVHGTSNRPSNNVFGDWKSPRFERFIFARYNNGVDPGAVCDKHKGTDFLSPVPKMAPSGPPAEIPPSPGWPSADIS